jgi:hypothetical protein
MDFQSMVAVSRDIDRYSDRVNKSGAIFLFDAEDRFALVFSAAPMLVRTRAHGLEARGTCCAAAMLYLLAARR